MRIVAGSLKGRTITTPGGQGTRPTSDRARQAIFNVLEHAAWAEPLEGMRVMDLYAGSGALGFEALSRGAAFALFVETDEEARGAIRENADAFHVMGRTRVHRRSAIDLGPRPRSDGEAFDLLLNEGDQLELGRLSITLLHTPGHTPACVTYRIGDAAFVGDTRSIEYRAVTAGISFFF